MKFDVMDLNPVAIALDYIEVEGDVRFSGLDLDSGTRVVVTIQRKENCPGLQGETAEMQGLVLMLTLGSPAEVA